MCGIAAVFCSDRSGVPRNVIEELTGSLRHRGPDAQAAWLTEDRTVALVHTRLAIVDLSPTGAQPMASRDGRYQIVFNGEIYNHEELRRDLEARGHVFRGTSDTEVLLQLFASRGERMLDVLDGMFAFVIYDTVARTAFCARDALGEKPLYFTRSARHFALASEVRALVRAGLASTSVDPRGIGLLLRQGSIPAPYTHLSDVRMLEPGSFLRVDARTLTHSSQRWWSIPFRPESSVGESRDEALERIDAALRLSAQRRLRADVPVAAFLSGGVDSTMVCALLREVGARDLHTFTVTLPGQPGDEAKRAAAIARQLGTVHTEIPLDLAADGSWLDRALEDMDVPSNDGPNTWLVARAVHDAGFKVACSGVGGDELFFGYPSFRVVPRATRWASPLRPLRRIPTFTRAIGRRIPAPPRVGRVVDAALAGGDVAAMWLAKRGMFSARECADLMEESAHAIAREVDPIARIASLGQADELPLARAVSFFELSVYMHDQLLRDTDVMSMAHALEVRLPLLGLPVVEAVARTSTDVLLGDRPKAVLRTLVERRVPPSLMEAPKQGFVLNWRDILGRRGLEGVAAIAGLKTSATAWEWRRFNEGAAPARLLSLLALSTATRPRPSTESALARGAPRG